MKQPNNDSKRKELETSAATSSEYYTTHNTMREALPGEKDLLTELRESIEPTDTVIDEMVADWSTASGGRSQPPPYSVSSWQLSKQ